MQKFHPDKVEAAALKDKLEKRRKLAEKKEEDREDPVGRAKNAEQTYVATEVFAAINEQYANFAKEHNL